jgi:hypothetical protein
MANEGLQIGMVRRWRHAVIEKQRITMLVSAGTGVSQKTTTSAPTNSLARLLGTSGFGLIEPLYNGSSRCRGYS